MGKLKLGYQRHEEHIGFILNRVLKGLYEMEIQNRRNRKKQEDSAREKETITASPNEIPTHRG